MSRDPSAVRPTLEALERRENPTVNYYGGNLLTSVEAQPVYYGSAWAGDTTTGTLDSYTSTLVGGAYMDALHSAGYGVGRGTATAGVVDAVALTAGSTITDASIQARLKADIANGTLPANDAQRLYTVYVQKDVAVDLGNGQGTTQQGILGYHGAFTGANGQAVRYAVVAYPGGAAHNSSLGTTAVDQLTAVASHETAEAVTDPDVNYSKLGWYDPQQGEIGDITENNPAAYVRLGGFLVQEVADKNDNLLSIAPPQSPPPPVSPPAGQTGTTTTLTATPVQYHGWYATTSLTITVTPAKGGTPPTGTIDLIYGGRVIGKAKLHTVNGVATATFNIVFYANGSYTFDAKYEGSTAFTTSTSPPLTVNV